MAREKQTKEQLQKELIKLRANQRVRNKIETNKDYVYGQWMLTGNAAKLVKEKIEQQQEAAVSKYGKLMKYGKEAAINFLLNELWNIKHPINEAK